MNHLEHAPNVLAPYFRKGIEILFWFLLVAAVVVFFLHAILSITYPYPLDYGEAPLIDQAMHLAAGENIYRPSLETPPFTVANYPPLYVISLIPLVDSGANLFQMGRMISTIAALASALFLGLTSFHLFEHRLAAITTGILFLSFPYVVEWSGRARIDCLALAFATAAIYIFARWPKSRWGFFGGGLLLVAAVYTRQSYALAAPLAAFIWLWTNEKLRAIQLVLLVGGFSGILFLLLNSLTEGGFYFNIVTANINEFRFDLLKASLGRLWQDAGVILVLSVTFLLITWRHLKGWALLAPFLVGGFLSALTSGKIGANVNYFLELTAALSLVGGALIAWSYKHTWRFALVLLLLSIQIGMLMAETKNGQADGILASRWGDLAALQRLERIVQDLEGPIPADEYMGMLTMEGRPLYIQPFEVSQLANAGRWDQGPFLEEIANQRFEGILIHHFGTFPLHKERWTPEMLAAIEEHYRPAKTLAGNVVFIPQDQTEISRVPVPTRKPSSEVLQMRVGETQAVSDVSNFVQPDIAVNPIHPKHLAAIATHSTQFECNPPNCKTELLLHISTNGGQTWTKNTTFSNINNTFSGGLVDFDSDNQLYAMAIRDNTIIYNLAGLDDNYLMSGPNSRDITRSQVVAKPWFRVHPENGRFYVTLDAREEDTFSVTPSVLRSERDGHKWTTTSRADLRVSVADFITGRATWPDDIQILFGKGQNVSLVWTWGWEPWAWPRTVWMANSTNGGEMFGEPTPILETWGPTNSTSSNGRFAIAYRTRTEEAQNLAVAFSEDNGQTWSSAIASGDVPLYFDPDHGPGIGMAPDGTIDLTFLAHGDRSADCILDIESWQETFHWGWIDLCNYNVYYTFSAAGDLAFGDPVRLNGKLVEGESLARFEGRSTVGSHLAVASSDEYAYPVWIGTTGKNETQVHMVQITR